jgi:hypothetical protein
MGSQGHVRSTSRIRSLVRIFSVLSLTVFSVGLALSTLVFLWVPYEDTGISFNGDAVDAVAAGSAAAKAGVRVGDRFDPATSFFERGRIGWSNRPADGQTYTFRVLRDGTLRTIHLQVAKESAVPAWSLPDSVEYVVGMLAFIILLSVGTVLVLARPNPLTWMFFLFCVGNPTSKLFGAVDVLTSMPMPLGFILNMIRTTLLIVSYIAFLDFALRFPKMRAVGWRRVVELGLPLLLIFYLADDYRNWFWQFYSVDTHSILGWPYTLVVIAVVCEVIAAVSLLGTYRMASIPDRHRYSWVVVGVLVTYSVILLRDVLGAFNMLEGDTLWICICSQTLTAFAPVALAYGTLKHRVIDVSFVVNRAVVYAVVTAVLVIVFESFTWLIERLIQHTRTVEILQLVLAIAIGISLQHSFRRIEAIVNRWFFKSVHDAQQHLSRIAATLLSAESSGALERTLVGEPVRVLKLTAGALFRRRAGGGFERTAATGWSDEDNHCFDDDDPLVLHLQERQSAVSMTDSVFPGSYLLAKTKCADEAVPVFSQGALTAIALYGPHVSGTRIDPLERSTLTNLAAAAEQGYDALQTRLENIRRVSELLEQIDSSVAYGDLHYYVADQLIQAVPERTRTSLLACAVIPRPTADDIIYATGDEENVERLQLLCGSAILHLNPDATYALHPLIRHVLLKHAGGTRKEMLLRCARAWQERHHHRRAAQLYREAGMHAYAAAASTASPATT